MFSSDPTGGSRTIEASEPVPSCAPKLQLVCRQIRDDDLDAAVACLARGFPERSAAYWRRGLMRLHARTLPEGRPRYGYMLTADSVAVGIVLVIFAETDEGETRANVSSWYVDEAYRGYSNMLLASAFRAKDATFVNISPSPTTLATIAAQGFSRFVPGTFHAMAAFGRRVPGASVRTISADAPGAPGLLAEHAACGCICLEVVLHGEAHPFVFVASRNASNRLPSAQLVYCRDVADFVRFAGPIGRHLVRLGLASIMVDATGPISGLVGRYAAGRRMKYFRGPVAPRLGDLSSTELVYLGP